MTGFCGSLTKPTKAQKRPLWRRARRCSLIVTAKLNDVDPKAWLADTFRRINDHPVSRLDELLPWNWRPHSQSVSQAA